jgi:hypothetical protein
MITDKICPGHVAASAYRIPIWRRADEPMSPRPTQNRVPHSESNGGAERVLLPAIKSFLPAIFLKDIFAAAAIRSPIPIF